MRVQFAFAIGQPVTIKSSSRNGTVEQLNIDLARKQSAQVRYIDGQGRQVIEWFAESALVAANITQ